MPEKPRISQETIDDVYYRVLEKVVEGWTIKAAIKEIGFERKTLYRRIDERRKDILKQAKRAHTSYKNGLE